MLKNIVPQLSVYSHPETPGCSPVTHKPLQNRLIIMSNTVHINKTETEEMWGGGCGVCAF